MSEVHWEKVGVVFDIQRYSIHDGPGIRTIVFLNGCPLRCRWCCNPESQQLDPNLMYLDSSCIRCGRCIETCGVGALSRDDPNFVNREQCVACGKCVEVCPTGALSLRGKAMTVRQVVQELAKDATSYRRSGGGVTLSGGEPLVQSDFALELLRACKQNGWSTAMETTGCVSKEIVEKVMPLVDHALVDIKAIDPAVHKANTGVDNRLILENALRIAHLTQTVVRVPVVPGVNADPGSIAAIAQFAKLMQTVETMHLLPYHTYGENKYALLGRDYPMGEVPTLSCDRIEELKRVVESHGLNCVIGG